jgi:2-amino-4-hydroxy-6-hydroxymethyldihydropteridine diphosphokinase
VILLGSNIDKERNLPAAVRLLRQQCHVLACSSVYETLAAGTPGYPNFLNAAVLIETPLDTRTLKQEVLAAIEQQLHRVRTDDPNAPRTLDADVILFNDAVFDWNGRHIPDPDLLRFPHVARPVADLLPDMSHPETGELLATLAGRLEAQATAGNHGEPVLWPRPDMDALLSTGAGQER